MSLCYDASKKQWVGGCEGTRLRIEQLKAAMVLARKAHDVETIKQQEMIDASNGTIKGAVAGQNSGPLTYLYEAQRELREMQAVLREEEERSAERGDPT